MPAILEREYGSASATSTVNGIFDESVLVLAAA
jgi:hypothetical protein